MSVLVSYQTLRARPADAQRQAIRLGEYQSHTAGLGKGCLQANVVITPAAYALDFMRFCQRNPKPCPLIGVSDTGNPDMFTLGADIDIRTDIPAYNIYRYGELADTVPDIRAIWNDDLVAFALGCSFTFEHALLEAGIDVWHISNNSTVPMYRTSIFTVPAGPFRGGSVVSMRMIPSERVDEAVAISSRFPLAHGSPVHIGDPAAIDIADLSRPDWGDPVPMPVTHTPVFWACGVTPQAIIRNAKLPICITHKPGTMLLTEVPDDADVPLFQKS
ncbi:putative hydro-lyase [Breoghania corrubedonensis]|uniref:putative hydro-lyase n=1 Tax=Breoghania corrubedonensis TaxID=665038 RepID=UPI001AED05A3